MQPGIVSHHGDIQSQCPSVCNRVSDIGARLEKSEGLGEGDFAEHIKREEVKPFVELDGMPCFSQGIEPGFQKLQELINLGLELDDAGQRIAPGHVSGLVDVSLRVEFRHLIHVVIVWQAED